MKFKIREIRNGIILTDPNGNEHFCNDRVEVLDEINISGNLPTNEPK